MTLNPSNEAPHSIWRGGEKKANLPGLVSRAGNEGSRSRSPHAAGLVSGNANVCARKAEETGSLAKRLTMPLCVDGSVCCLRVYRMNLPDKVLETRTAMNPTYCSPFHNTYFKATNKNSITRIKNNDK